MLDLHEGVLSEFAERATSGGPDWRGLHIRHLSTRTPEQRKALTLSRTERGLCLRCDNRVESGAVRCETCRAKRRRPERSDLDPGQAKRREKYQNMLPEVRSKRLAYLKARRQRNSVTPERNV